MKVGSPLTVIDVLAVGGLGVVSEGEVGVMTDTRSKSTDPVI